VAASLVDIQWSLDQILVRDTLGQTLVGARSDSSHHFGRIRDGSKKNELDGHGATVALSSSLAMMSR